MAWVLPKLRTGNGELFYTEIRWRSRSIAYAACWLRSRFC
jgi:hypothetical protein